MATPVYNASSQGETAAGTSLTVQHTCSGSNRALLLFVGTDGATPPIPTARYKTVAMDQLGTVLYGGDNHRLTAFRLISPSLGANNIVVSTPASSGIFVAAASFINVLQTSSLGEQGTNSADDNDPTLFSPLTSEETELVVSGVGWENGGDATSIVADVPLVKRVDNSNAPGDSVAIGTSVGAESVLTDWTITGLSVRWAMLSVALKYAGHISVRTNEDEVKAALSANKLFPDSEVSLIPYMISAKTIVDDIASTAANRGITVTSARLKLIETYISAHFYALSDPQPQEEKTGRASSKYQGDTDKYWELTWWGQMAVALDPTNSLKKGVRIGLTWLGTPRESRPGIYG